MESKRSSFSKNALYDVKCVKGHVFLKFYETKNGYGIPKDREIKAYCPHCDAIVMVRAVEKIKKGNGPTRGMPGDTITMQGIPTTLPKPPGTPAEPPPGA
jgi:hypothetical protein